MPEGNSNPNAIDEDPFDTEEDGAEADAKDSDESSDASDSDGAAEPAAEE
jgi:hypothetical protein